MTLIKNGTLAAAAFLSSIGTEAFAAPQKNQSPNLLLFIADDCTFSDLGCYGSPDSKTPNIDRMASEGMLFERAYQSSAVSSPTRHNLYTGLWPMKTGAYPNHTQVEPGTISIVHHLAAAGYRVALFGKSHVGPQEAFPWDVYADFLKGAVLDFGRLEQFIKECEAQGVPFCAIVASSEPHSPWNKGDASQFDPRKLKLPPMWVDIPETRAAFARYLAEVNHMDAQVGRVTGILRRTGVYDNSAMIFTSEQGNSFPFAKWTCYDQGVHTAMIVRWPAVVSAGSRSDAIVEYVDVLPTLLDIAGAEARGPLDGRSFVSLLRGRVGSHKQYTYSQHTSRGIIAGPEYFGTRSVADEKYRYIINFTPEVPFRNTETNGKLFKLWIERGEQGDAHAKAMTHNYLWRPARELYDTDQDPYCMNDLAGDPAYSEVVERLDGELRRWMEECGDRGQQTEMEALEHKASEAKGAK